MFPDVSSALMNWTRSTQMAVVKKAAVDYEVQETITDLVWFDAMLVPMKPQEVDRKPENERIWKWWTMITKKDLQIDTVLQDPSCLRFRVQSKEDWSQAGFIQYGLVEQPKDFLA